ncbi:metalloregulator ArsR/SmtB family transcription factor [Colwellia sp. M166]|jgi:DNA-binding transcriptional ArsR family regulator|uniref:ArsR/SmtB family transcription factor n=1 Tax=Colwellia sp. M166 TaxID=2583805 RepID=UPI00211EE28E|nr:metalloregulator ArsR/SmtB family transcription factor [Colwellia sp. M166]|tara:strand:- start:82669 stop:82980 length:312 start_codon:yes stop_codon:yes gene_type:complete
MAELAEINIKDMQENSAQAADLLKAMSNQHRLLILCHLGEKEMSVTALNNVIELSQSSLSQHLARLRQDGLVKTRRESQTIFYSIANPSVVKLISFLHSEFCQ